jgi:hypothetical protein
MKMAQESFIQYFWTSERILLALTFIIGLIIGGFATNQFIDPYLNSAKSEDYNSMKDLVDRLNERNDQLLQCLRDNGIDQTSCTN